MPAITAARQIPAPESMVCRRVTRVQMDASSATCSFSGHDPSLGLSRFIGGFVRAGDEMEFDPAETDPGKEIRVLQRQPGGAKELYFATIGYVAQPKPDKRGEFFVRADVPESRLGVKQIHVRNEAMRDYFYFSNRRRAGCKEETLYDLLRVARSASATDLRLVWKLRLLELGTANGSRDQLQAIERAFNLVANPNLRSCYDSLLLDDDVPALFPYGGFGSIVVAGQLSPDRETFFASRILSFLPEYRTRRFRAPLRKVEFLNDRAVYRDSQRKVEIFL